MGERKYEWIIESKSQSLSLPPCPLSLLPVLAVTMTLVSFRTYFCVCASNLIFKYAYTPSFLYTGWFWFLLFVFSKRKSNMPFHVSYISPVTFFPQETMYQGVPSTPYIHIYLTHFNGSMEFHNIVKP